jgi:hypothetical protein
MTIEELCKRSYDIAVSKGWHEQKRSLGEAVALFHSEVSETLECFRDPSHQPGDMWHSEGGKPEGMVFELADLLIRIADTSVDMALPVAKCLLNTTVGMLGYGHTESMLYNGHEIASIPDMLAVIHVYLARAFDAGYAGSEKGVGLEVSHKLACAMNTAGAICRIQGWDLEKAVVEKFVYNETRPHRHGGKRA